MHYCNFFTRSFWPQVKCSTCGCQVSAELQVPTCSTQELHLDLLPWVHMRDDIREGVQSTLFPELLFECTDHQTSERSNSFFFFLTIKALPNTPCIQLP